MEITFEKYTEVVTIRVEQFLETEIIEYRKDPLTDLWVRINLNRAKREKEMESNFKEYLNKTKPCPFCKDNIFKVTPEPRHILGRSVAFPNRYPFAKFHYVIVLNYENHDLTLEEVNFLDFYNSLKLAFDIYKSFYEKNKDYVYFYVNMNYTFSSGASQGHLHFQVFADKKPTNYLRLIQEKAIKYFNSKKRCIFEDLVEIEKEKNERFIKEGKMIDWIASFAPFANNEVLGIIKSFGICNMAENNFEKFVKEFYDFLMNYINKLNVKSLNFTIYDVSYLIQPGMRPFIRIVSRKNPVEFYTNDRGFMEVLHLEPVIEVLPEDLAKILK